MMQRTKISWATHTWNPAVGCSKVSTGCLNCYAKEIINRFPWMTGHGDQSDTDDYNGWDGQTHFFPERLVEPFKLRPGKERPHRIFVCSMGDLFHESTTNEQIATVFGVMAACPQHAFVVLTKRPDRASRWSTWLDSQLYKWPDQNNTMQCDWRIHALAQSAYDFTKYDGEIGPLPELWPLPNVWIGVSVEDQRSADERIPLLLQIPAAKRLVSVEPMLGPVRLDEINIQEDWLIDALDPGGDNDRYLPQISGVDWVICGAETGPGKRPMDEEWAFSLREQCVCADVPFFFKKDSDGLGTLACVECREWPDEVMKNG